MIEMIDHHQAADSGVLSQAVCLTGIAVSCVSSHELWLPWESRIVVMIEMIETCCGTNIGRGEEELLR
jgi:hypothetical protein